MTASYRSILLCVAVSVVVHYSVIVLGGLARVPVLSFVFALLVLLTAYYLLGLFGLFLSAFLLLSDFERHK